MMGPGYADNKSKYVMQIKCMTWFIFESGKLWWFSDESQERWGVWWHWWGHENNLCHCSQEASVSNLECSLYKILSLLFSLQLDLIRSNKFGAGEHCKVILHTSRKKSNQYCNLKQPFFHPRTKSQKITKQTLVSQMCLQTAKSTKVPAGTMTVYPPGLSQVSTEYATCSPSLQNNLDFQVLAW